MDDLTSLLTHYDFWDCLVEKWRDGEFGRDTHMPEPWWGWHPENGPLYSVTVNLSPGVAGKLQNRQCIECAAGCFHRKYSLLMLDGTLRTHLRETETWHLNRRHKPMMRLFENVVSTIPADTRHHLSVELYPFHAKENDAENKAGGYEVPLGQCRENLTERALLFAAEASQFIVPPFERKQTDIASKSNNSLSLKNIVIVRAALKSIKEYLGPKQRWKDIIEINENKGYVTVEAKKFPVFRLSTKKKEYSHVSDVVFVCISGARNMLVKKDTLGKIIQQTNQSYQQI